MELSRADDGDPPRGRRPAADKDPASNTTFLLPLYLSSSGRFAGARALGRARAVVARSTKSTAPRGVRSLSAGSAVGFPGDHSEIGVVKAESAPIVVITIDPNAPKSRRAEAALPLSLGRLFPTRRARSRYCAPRRRRAPEAPDAELVAFVQKIRKQDLFQVARRRRNVGWASALTELDAVALDPAQVSDTLGVLLKYQDDIVKIQGAKAHELIEQRARELRLAELR